MATLVPIQYPTQSLHFQRLHCSSRRWSKVPSTTFIARAPIIIIKANKPIPLCYPLSASLLEEDSPPSPSLDESSIEDAVQLPLSGCKACGREKLENGCNGEGRIQGGIATVPGFGWWPIKAFRPCPGFVESGGRYRRRGQSMDEVAWGRGEREVSMVSTDEVQSSKKSQSSSPRRFKR